MDVFINKLFRKLQVDALWEELKPANQIGLKMCCIGSGAQHQNVRSGVQYQNGLYSYPHLLDHTPRSLFTERCTIWHYPAFFFQNLPKKEILSP